jgi:hypothetical protein
MRDQPHLATMEDDELRALSAKNFNASNFEHIWYYDEGYIDYDQSSELCQFFVKSKLLSDRFRCID